jgi:hypothetical protein
MPAVTQPRVTNEVWDDSMSEAACDVLHFLRGARATAIDQITRVALRMTEPHLRHDERTRLAYLMAGGPAPSPTRIGRCWLQSALIAICVVRCVALIFRHRTAQYIRRVLRMCRVLSYLKL